MKKVTEHLSSIQEDKQKAPPLADLRRLEKFVEAGLSMYGKKYNPKDVEKMKNI